MKFYTGVGSRKTPKEILKLITEIGYKLYLNGWILRSGAAKGADKAFELKVPQKRKRIYTPKNFDFEEYNYSFCYSEIKSVMDSHLDIDDYNPYCKTLILRDVNQVLGSQKTKDHMVKSKFLVCWTPHPDYNKVSFGGTRFAVRIAVKYHIKIYNLCIKEDYQKITEWLSRK